MFNAFKNIAPDLLQDLGGGSKLSLGVHNTLLQGANMTGYSTATAMGAGVGAAYGGATGAFSYDGSILGGAFHGAMVGAIGGSAFKMAANNYARGAVDLKTAVGDVSSGYSSSWNKAFRFEGKETEELGAFSLDAFGRGMR